MAEMTLRNFTDIMRESFKWAGGYDAPGRDAVAWAIREIRRLRKRVKELEAENATLLVVPPDRKEALFLLGRLEGNAALPDVERFRRYIVRGERSQRDSSQACAEQQAAHAKLERERDKLRKRVKELEEFLIDADATEYAYECCLRNREAKIAELEETVKDYAYNLDQFRAECESLHVHAEQNRWQNPGETCGTCAMFPVCHDECDKEPQEEACCNWEKEGGKP